MSGEMGMLSPEERKIYLEECIKILNRNITRKSMERKRMVMKANPFAVSTRIPVTE
jgi:hypothetical protein